MKSKLLSQAGGLRTFVVVFEIEDEPVSGLKAFARTHNITAAHVAALGAFRRVSVGYFEWEKKDYRRIEFDEQMEVLALEGNIGSKGEEVALHLHATLGRSDGTAHGGHLLEARVRPTLEVIVSETPAHLRRTFDEATGLHLIDADA